MPEQHPRVPAGLRCLPPPGGESGRGRAGCPGGEISGSIPGCGWREGGGSVSLPGRGRGAAHPLCPGAAGGGRLTRWWRPPLPWLRARGAAGEEAGGTAAARTGAASAGSRWRLCHGWALRGRGRAWLRGGEAENVLYRGEGAGTGLASPRAPRQGEPRPSGAGKRGWAAGSPCADGVCPAPLRVKPSLCC